MRQLTLRKLITAAFLAYSAPGVHAASLTQRTPQDGTPAGLVDEGAEDCSTALEALRAQGEVPGLIALAVQEDRVVAFGAAGVRAGGSSAALALSDPMHLGSCAKAMTATLAAVLVEEGLLSFDTTIAEALPELANKIDKGFHDVTLDMLLRHRGGIAERRRPELEALYASLDGPGGTPAQARLALLAQVMAPPPLPPADGGFDYSNFGYMTVGAMAEAATHRTWEELMVEKVFRPLDMESAGTGSPAGEGVPVGHRTVEDRFEPLPPGPAGALPAAMGPAGLVHASLPDWGRFVGDHLRGERGEDGLLRAETYRHLHADLYSSGYAAGWGLARHTVSWSEPTLSLTHSGSDGTWFSVVQAMPEWDLTIMAAANGGGPAASVATEAAKQLLLERLGFKD